MKTVPGILGENEVNAYDHQQLGLSFILCIILIEETTTEARKGGHL